MIFIHKLNPTQIKELKKRTQEYAIELKKLSKKLYLNGHKGHDKFRQAIKTAQLTYHQLKQSTNLTSWQVQDNNSITWKEVWVYIISLSLRGLVEVVTEYVRGGFLWLQKDPVAKVVFK